MRIVGRAPAATTVSAVAGAVWFPYRAGPPDRVAAWAARTREWLEGLAADPRADAGVDLLTGYEITEAGAGAPPRPWWATEIPVARVPAPVRGAPGAWQFRAPRVEPARFLPWITARLRAPIEQRAVRELAAEPGDAVINCTGLGARELLGDLQLGALLGQIVITEPGQVDRGVTITDDRRPDEVFYLIPRRSELVLGGCSVPWPADAPPAIDAARTARILEQARAFGLEVGPVRDVRVGLRPFRADVRLERDPAAPRIIHNYGHGGSGYTLCRGCAEEVAALLGPTAGGATAR